MNKLESIDNENLTLENIEFQFCSDWLKDQIKKVFIERDSLQSKLSIAKTALDFYAEGKNYIERHTEGSRNGRAWTEDYLDLHETGDIARKALEEIETSPETKIE